ncbi:hypothetical protein FHS85_004789 [Rhodoligotrophos appendicifer]|uniref:DNA gyrase inhibitor YacG n=1 Tax=Rhodoligotrophos appendicifer TaxID=987056 RepID=UPI00319E500D
MRLRPRRGCAVCGKTTVQKYHPFCSARCADVDLHRWLSGHYRIPGSAVDLEETDGAEGVGEGGPLPSGGANDDWRED